MKKTDESIDRVLAGLRDVEAPQGMERRVLAAIEGRAAERAGFPWRAWSFGLAAAVVLVGAVVVSVVPRHVYRPSVAVVKLPVIAPVPASVALVQRRNTEILRYAQNDLRIYPSRSGAPAAEEPVAGGIPAPPMPLTEQEKLLLRLAHRSDPQELTPLIAEVREKREAEFDAEFQEFFAPPTPVTDEKKTNPTNDDKGESR